MAKKLDKPGPCQRSIEEICEILADCMGEQSESIEEEFSGTVNPEILPERESPVYAFIPGKIMFGNYVTPDLEEAQELDNGTSTGYKYSEEEPSRSESFQSNRQQGDIDMSNASEKTEVPATPAQAEIGYFGKLKNTVWNKSFLLGTAVGVAGTIATAKYLNQQAASVQEKTIPSV